MNPMHDQLYGLACAASIELTPRHILGEARLLDWLPSGTLIYVPYLPSGLYEDTISACARLLAEGLVPVPHFPARAIESMAHARDWLDRLQTTGVSHLMLIAGDKNEPAGPFADTLTLLESGLLTEYPFALGIAGHPEGHPHADHSVLMDALRFKREYAAATKTRMWVVTQFAFEAHSFTDWLDSAAEVITPLPVCFGVAGPTRLHTLLAYAAQCGIGASTRALMQRPDTARLLRSWSPDDLVHALAGYKAHHPQSLFQAIHIFPFGGLKRSAKWLEELRDEVDSSNRTELYSSV